MATSSLSCRLKALSSVSSIASSKELSRSLLTKSKGENERSFCSSNNSFIDALDETKGNMCRGHRCQGIKEGWPLYVAKDVPRYESLRGILLTINREKNTFDRTPMNKCTKIRVHSPETKKNVQRTSLFVERSSIVSRFSLATIYHSWKFSKESCPSTGHFCSFVRKLSSSTLKLYPSVGNPIYEKFSSRKMSENRRNSCQMIIHRCSSSDGPSCKKGPKPECPAKSTSGKEKLFQDICPEKKSSTCEMKPTKECPDSSRPFKTSCDEPDPVCATPPCENIQDYCREQVHYQEKFWRMLVCFVAMPLLLIMSIYVYLREQENKKLPRPEFEDLPWMGRINKPFPWGDGKHSFFHNPHRNPISPHGYEVEDPNAVKKDDSSTPEP